MKTEYYIEHCPGVAGGLKQIIRPLISPFSTQVSLATTFDVDYFVCKAFTHKAVKINVKVLKAQVKGPRIRLVCYNYVGSSIHHSHFGLLRRALAFKIVKDG